LPRPEQRFGTHRVLETTADLPTNEISSSTATNAEDALLDLGLYMTSEDLLFKNSWFSMTLPIAIYFPRPCGSSLLPLQLPLYLRGSSSRYLHLSISTISIYNGANVSWNALSAKSADVLP